MPPNRNLRIRASGEWPLKHKRPADREDPGPLRRRSGWWSHPAAARPLLGGQLLAAPRPLLSGQLLAAFGAPACQNAVAANCGASFAKAVAAFAHQFARLVGPFHRQKLRIVNDCRRRFRQNPESTRAVENERTALYGAAMGKSIGDWDLSARGWYWGSSSNGTESRIQRSFGSLSGRSLPRAT